MPDRIHLKLITSNAAQQSVVLARQPFGEGARIRLNLDQKDQDENRYFIELPEHTYAITSSFLNGLLAPSTFNLLEEQFRDKYTLDCVHENHHLELIRSEIDDWIKRRYQEFSMFNAKD